MSAAIHQFPQRPSGDAGEDLFSLRFVRLRSGRVVGYFGDIAPAEFETNEMPHARMRRLGLLALEGAANLLTAADNFYLSETCTEPDKA